MANTVGFCFSGFAIRFEEVGVLLIVRRGFRKFCLQDLGA